MTEREGDLSRVRASSRRAEAARSLAQLRPGDIIRVPGGRRAGLAVVLQPGLHPARGGNGNGRPADRAGRGSGSAAPAAATAGQGQPGLAGAAGNGGLTEFTGPGPLVLTEGRQVKRLAVADFPVPAEVIDKIRIPASFSPRSPQHRKDLAATMRNRLASHDRGPAAPSGAPPARRTGSGPPPRPRATSRTCGDGFGAIRATTARTARTTPGTPNVTCGWRGRPRRSSAGWPAGRT